ncbi:hypothetical protein FQZ97_398170 [compost metagenome]
MHRDPDATAALLGQRPRKFRQRLRALGILTQSGELACKHREGGYLFTRTKSRWNRNIGAWTHYGVVMVTEKGVAWLAKQLGIQINEAPEHKDAAA